MNRKISIIAVSLILILGSITVSGTSLQKEKKIESTLHSNNNSDYEVYIGHMQIVWNKGAEKYDYSFNYEESVEEVIFEWLENNLGEKIRLK